MSTSTSKASKKTDKKTDKKGDKKDTEEKKKRVRRNVTDESVTTDKEELLKFIQKEINRRSEGKIEGVRILRTINKRMKQLTADFTRLLKAKKKTNRKTDKNSGFQKPVEISAEMLTFTGWEKKMYSRVAVTRFICDYIKKHDLQDKEDGRNINPDEALCKLLRWNKSNKDPLTYFRVQSNIQHHFIKPPPLSKEEMKRQKKAKAAAKKEKDRAEAEAKEKAAAVATPAAASGAAPANAVETPAVAAPAAAPAKKEDSSKMKAAVASAKKNEKKPVESDEDDD